MRSDTEMLSRFRTASARFRHCSPSTRPLLNCSNLWITCFHVSGGPLRPGYSRISRDSVRPSFRVTATRAGISSGNLCEYSGVGRTEHAAEQLLNIGALDAVRRKLRWQNLVVEKRHGNQVRQAVVGIFLRADDALVALFAAADDLVGDVEGLDVDAIDLGAENRCCRFSSSAASIAVWA